MDELLTYIIMGSISGVFLVITLHSMFKAKLFWVADCGADLGFTLLAPVILNGNPLTALAMGVAFTVILRTMNMFMPGEKLLFVIERGFPRLRWIPTAPKGLPWKSRHTGVL